jgi:D-alanine-D-alanine ligase
MRTVVGVFRGGPSSEYEVSLKTGMSVLESLDREKYEPKDLFIDRSGEWHLHGVAVPPEKALHGIDVAFNAMHGEFGEDGTVQRLLDRLQVPYTGSGSMASATAFNKHLTKEQAKKLGVKTAPSIVVEADEDTEALAHRIFRSFPHPAVVKPLAGGSSVGTNVANNFHQLHYALDEGFKISPRVLVEEYIKGREATVGVLDHFRGQRAYALMPVEIIPPARHSFFSYEAKYGGETIERVPGNFTNAQKTELERLAKLVHEGLGLDHYSRSDFIISRRGIYFLEVNTLPGLTKESLLPKALHAVGAKLSDFLDHVIQLARKKK